MGFPILPARAAYIILSNPARRNALSLNVLRDLEAQITRYNQGPADKADRKVTLLPPFKRWGRENIVRPNDSHYKETRWLHDTEAWNEQRGGLPTVLVLRSEGPVFSSGHDLAELKQMSADEVKSTFATCSTVLDLLRRCPQPVVCAVQGLATAAGFALAMSTDYPIALADTKFCLPGAHIGLPCTQPSVAVSRRLSPSITHRLLLTGDPIRADQMYGAVDVVPVPEHAESTDTAAAAFEHRIDEVINRLVGMAAQPQALGKWAFWSQLEFGSDQSEVAPWAQDIMVAHSKTQDGKEGVSAFLEKRKAEWKT
jgi:enoyl-CoA hydratase/carnithine racemase